VKTTTMEKRVTEVERERDIVHPYLLGGSGMAPPPTDEKDGEPMSTKQIIQITVLLVLFYVGNVCINMYNKWLFGSKLKIPLFVTMSQQLFCFTLTLGLTLFPSIYKRTVLKGGRSMWIQLTLVPLIFAANIGLNNMSLKYMALSANVLVRSTGPIFVAILGFMIAGTRESYGKILCMMGLVLGVLLAVLNNPDFNFLGTMLCVGSVAGASLWTVLVANLMSSMQKLQVFDVLLYCAFPIMICLFPAVALTGELSLLVQYVADEGLTYVMLLLTGAGVLTWAYCVVMFTFINTVGALFSSVASSFKTVPILAFSIMFFHESPTLINYIGMGIAVASFACNTYLKIYERECKNAEDASTEEQEALLAGKLASAEKGLPVDALKVLGKVSVPERT